MRKSLIAIGDSEGVPHKDNKKNVWNVCLIFKYLFCVDSVNPVFHTAHFSCEKNIGKRANKPLSTFFDNVNMLKHEYNVDDIYIGFWNAPHDVSVLRASNIDHEFKYIDLLKWARDIQWKERPSRFSVDGMYKHFKGKNELNQLHTGLGDTLRTVKIVQSIQQEQGLTEMELISQLFNYEYKPKLNTKHYKDETSSINRRNAIKTSTDREEIVERFQHLRISVPSSFSKQESKKANRRCNIRSIRKLESSVHTSVRKIANLL